VPEIKPDMSQKHKNIRKNH